MVTGNLSRRIHVNERMKTKIVKLLLLLALPGSLFAQKIDNTISYRDVNAKSYFRINYENDFFSASDKNYTQGYDLELVTPGLKRNPINCLFLKPRNSVVKYGITVGQIGFTPEDYVSSKIQLGDRPFASTAMIKSFKVATDTLKKQRISQSLLLGLIGPASFGKEIQTGIHRAIGDKMPGGWDNQIKNDVILNYRLDYEKQLLKIRNIFALNGNSSVQAGTLFTNAAVGANAVFGIIDAPFSSGNDRKKFQLYAYAQPVARVVGYDATMQGGVFNRESPYTIPTADVKRFVGQFNYGIVMKAGKLYLEYARTEISKEFKTGEAAGWGGVKIGFGV